ncbi:MAG: CBS domain-containing protein [Gemmatimonadaceae bacterium]
MKAKDIMTASPCCCSPSDSLQEVARTMRDHDCGAVPIVDDGRVVGIVTDRDLAVRALASGMDPEAAIANIITREPSCCDGDADLIEVERVMSDQQVRRVPIVDADRRVVGIVSQADLARAVSDGRHVSEHEVALVFERVSMPRHRPFDHGVDANLEQPF